MDKNFLNILIVGAGEAGRQLAAELFKSIYNYKIVGFIDDYKTSRVGKIKIVGKISDLKKVLNEYDIDEVIIALPSLNHVLAQKIYRICQLKSTVCKIIPSDSDVISGKIDLKRIKKIGIKDVLRRPPTKEEFNILSKKIRDKAFMVTGGAGSIGSELVKQLSFLGARKVIVFDKDEFGIFKMQQSGEYGKNVKYFLGDINDFYFLRKIIDKEKPGIIFHAAAYKHVGLLEKNIFSAYTNNVLGTKKLLDLSNQCGVKKFVLISTDKAVHPICVMGATKRIAEKLLHCYCHKNLKTIFNIVRFGNVIGSSGSVIPIFEKQIASGGPVTVSSREVERYFMTIAAAVQLIIYTSTIKKRNKIFILNMGKPVKIISLARQMIRMEGAAASKGIKIKITNLKKGEKIKEVLYKKNTKLYKTENKNIFYVNNGKIDSKEFLDRVIKIEKNITKMSEKKLAQEIFDLSK